MEIPKNLLSEISAGNVILFLGAGASRCAVDSKGSHPPDGKALAKLIADKFLEGKYAEYPLNQVSEYAISETDLFKVQEFIRNIFLPFEPILAHQKLSTFSWRGLATTNYDLVIEKAYEKEKTKKLVPFVENGDRVDEKLRDPSSVPYLKLHGCINRVSNKDCPLILTIDQYVSYKNGRSRVFDHLKGWGYENPIVFAGYSVADPNIRQIIAELDETGSRPRYYVVAPAFDPIETRYWESKKITPIEGTFEDFVEKLDSSISSPFRGVRAPSPTEQMPIAKKFTHPNRKISENCRQFLENDVEFVEGITATELLTPRLFYKGFNNGWSAIEQNLDVARRVADTILSEHIVVEKSKRLSPEIIVLKGHAGSGKTVVLKRIAWEAAKSFGRLSLFLKSHGIINSEAINELIEACGQPIYLFIDDISPHSSKIGELISELGNNAGYLRIITAARKNEWNSYANKIDPFVTAEFELGFLTRPEINELVVLLEKHKALGKLEGSSREKCEQAFLEIAGRQLLVALYEATNGKPFEEIIADEFKKIVPQSAQQIYLTICVLNRLGVPVRAGIISRIHGITFAHFKDKIFDSLEEVVRFEYDSTIRDYVFQARHQYIAEIVFSETLKDMNVRFDEYLKCFHQLNLDYSSDFRAFQKMTHGRTLLELFPEHQMVESIYQAALEKSPDDPHLYHQIAIYELHRPNGNLTKAEQVLASALELAPWSTFIAHSLAEIYLKRAEQASSRIESSRYIEEVERRCAPLLESTNDSYAYHTLTKAKIKRLSLLMTAPDEPSNTEIQNVIRDAESCLEKGFKLFPNDTHLLGAESEFAKLISDSKRAILALEKAFKGNPRNAYAAVRLARYYRDSGNMQDCIGILKKAVEAAPMLKELHLALGRSLMLLEKVNLEELIYHFRRSFSPGDKSYDAQLLYARSLYLNGSIQEAKDIFKTLSVARVGHDLKVRLNYPIDSEFTGTVQKIEATYLFVVQDGNGEWIYAHRSNVDEAIWDTVSVGSRVSFKLNFSFKGPSASDLRLL